MGKYVFKEKGQAWNIYRHVVNEIRSHQRNPLSTIKIHDSTITVSFTLADRINALIKQRNCKLRKAK